MAKRRHPEPLMPARHDPYWMRAHRDWRFLLILVLMLACMGTYLFTLDLSWWPHHHSLVLVPLVAPAP
jgi:hypothetical protein